MNHSSLEILYQNEKEKHVKLIIEAILFSSNEPVALERICEAVQEFALFSEFEIERLLNQLKEEYLSHHSFQLDQVAGGYILRTSAAFSPYIEKIKGKKRNEKLSQAAIETLAIIAKKQPISKGGIDAVRGVDSSGVLQALIEKELIHITGKAQLPGKPSLYCVTDKFLMHFGITSAEEIFASYAEKK